MCIAGETGVSMTEKSWKAQGINATKKHFLHTVKKHLIKIKESFLWLTFVVANPIWDRGEAILLLWGLKKLFAQDNIALELRLCRVRLGLGNVDLELLAEIFVQVPEDRWAHGAWKEAGKISPLFTTFWSTAIFPQENFIVTYYIVH